MTQELCYVTFSTSAGWVGILGSASGLMRTTLPQHSASEAQEILGVSPQEMASQSHRFQNLIERLRIYFSGREVEFSDCVDLSGATAFQRQVWETTRLIPYGQTRAYGWVAEQIGKPKAARAVGQALGRNPLPVIIPCHRVIAGNGSLGGFSGGLEIKKQLLRLEAGTVVK